MKAVNGSLKDFRAENLMQAVHRLGCSVHSSREFAGKTYMIVISGQELIQIMDDKAEYIADVIVEDENGNQERIADYAEFSHLTESQMIKKLDAFIQKIVSDEEDRIYAENRDIWQDCPEHADPDFWGDLERNEEYESYQEDYTDDWQSEIDCYENSGSEAEIA